MEANAQRRAAAEPGLAAEARRASTGSASLIQAAAAAAAHIQPIHIAASDKPPTVIELHKRPGVTKVGILILEMDATEAEIAAKGKNAHGLCIVKAVHPSAPAEYILEAGDTLLEVDGVKCDGAVNAAGLLGASTDVVKLLVRTHPGPRQKRPPKPPKAAASDASCRNSSQKAGAGSAGGAAMGAGVGTAGDAQSAGAAGERKLTAAQAQMEAAQKKQVGGLKDELQKRQAQLAALEQGGASEAVVREAKNEIIRAQAQIAVAEAASEAMTNQQQECTPAPRRNAAATCRTAAPPHCRAAALLPAALSSAALPPRALPPTALPPPDRLLVGTRLTNADVALTRSSSKRWDSVLSSGNRRSCWRRRRRRGQTS